MFRETNICAKIVTLGRLKLVTVCVSATTVFDLCFALKISVSRCDATLFVT